MSILGGVGKALSAIQAPDTSQKAVKAGKIKAIKVKVKAKFDTKPDAK
jgi:hypothetical protein